MNGDVCLDLPFHNDNKPCTYLGHLSYVAFELVVIQTFWEPPGAAAIANPLESLTRFKVRSLPSVPIDFFLYIYLPAYNDSNYHAHSGHSQSVRVAYAVHGLLSSVVIIFFYIYFVVLFCYLGITCLYFVGIWAFLFDLNTICLLYG